MAFRDYSRHIFALSCSPRVIFPGTEYEMTGNPVAVRIAHVYGMFRDLSLSYTLDNQRRAKVPKQVYLTVKPLLSIAD
jgi:hypothetical protein